jgi:hypothetical protein
VGYLQREGNMPTHNYQYLVCAFCTMLFCLAALTSGNAAILHVPKDYLFIQLAINNALPGDTVMVSSGTYTEHISFGGKTLSLLSESGSSQTIIQTPALASVRAPLAVDTASSSERGLELRSVAESQSGTPVITIPPGSGSGTLIRGFTIDGLNATQGINCLQSDPTVTECIIQNCLGPYDGGAMWFQQSGAVIVKNVIRNNYTPITGAGVFVRLGTGHGTVYIEGNTLYGNSGGNGPAISLIEGDNAVVRRNVAYNNTVIPSSGRRGALFARGSNVKFHNNTSVGNTSGLTILMCDGIDIRNNILTNNLEYGLQYLNGEYPQNTNIASDYNDVWGNAIGNYYLTSAAVHDLSADPLFLAGHKLADGSPCIDAGDPDAQYNDPDGSRNDIGAIPRECCFGYRGNVNCDADGLCDISDLSLLIGHLFINRDPLCCSAAANVDRDGSVDISDLTELIDHLYLSQSPLKPCY